MAQEPIKRNGRRRKTQPATISMFEWALPHKQEREAEPAGVGR